MAKYGPHKKSIKKAFEGALTMRKEVLKEAMMFIHQDGTLSDEVVQQLEHDIVRRKPCRYPSVMTFIEQLNELDEMIIRLSAWL